MIDPVPGKVIIREIPRKAGVARVRAAQDSRTVIGVSERCRPIRGDKAVPGGFRAVTVNRRARRRAMVEFGG